MKIYVWMFALCLVAIGCGSDNEEVADDNWPNEEALANDEEAPEGNFGTMQIALPNDPGNGGGSCSLNITRITADRLANVIANLQVFAQGCDGMGNCENPNMQRGDMMYSGGIDGDNPFTTISFNYRVPSASEEHKMWMYDAIFNAEPFSRFEMQVDGSPYNILTSDTRGADNLLEGPHVWNTRLEIEADMVAASDEQSDKGEQARGTFVYEGLCEVYFKIM